MIDPDYNVYYQNVHTGERLGMKGIVMLDFPDFEPCSEKGCGWALQHSRDVGTPMILKGNHYYGLSFSKSNVAYFNEKKFFPKQDINWIKTHVGTSNIIFE